MEDAPNKAYRNSTVTKYMFVTMSRFYSYNLSGKPPLENNKNTHTHQKKPQTTFVSLHFHKQ